MEHRIHKQRKRRRKHASKEGIGGNGRGGEFLKRVDQIVERCLEDGEEAEAHADQPDHGRDPWDVFGGCPAEDEKPAGEEDGAQHHWREPRFGDGFIVVLGESFDIEFVVAWGWVSVDVGREEGVENELDVGCTSHYYS
jgi:hypothetical protein